MLTVLLLTGCQSRAENENQYNTVDMSDIDLALKESALAIQRSIKIMEHNRNYIAAKIVPEGQRDGYVEQINYMPKGLDTPITMNQRIPLKATIDLIAEMTGYKVLIVNDPVTDISVSTRVYAKPAIDVLRDMGVKLGDSAMISVVPFKDPKENGVNGVIKIIYANVIGGGR
jgi:hypothetical protein